MKVRALQPFAGPEGPVGPGDVVEIDAAVGAYLLRHGFAKVDGGAVSESRQRGSARARRASTSAAPDSRSDGSADRDEDDDASGKA